MDRRKRTCCFTGHRIIPQNQRVQIQRRLEETIESLVRKGVIYYGTGGALGFDTLAAMAVLKTREMHPEVKLILVLPCISQADRWQEKDRVIYEEIKRLADKVVYTSQEYTRGCMHKRNRHLVDNSGTCVCYLTECTGGTAYTVDYAQSKGLSIINIAGEERSSLG